MTTPELTLELPVEPLKFSYDLKVPCLPKSFTAIPNTTLVAAPGEGVNGFIIRVKSLPDCEGLVIEYNYTPVKKDIEPNA